MSHLSDIEAVKKAIVRGKQIAGAKINFDKSEGPAWTFPLERWTHSHPWRLWSATGAKLVGYGKGKIAGGYLASKVVVLKGKGGSVRHVHLPPFLYRLFVIPLPESHRRTLRQFLATLLKRGGKLMICRQVYYQRPHNGGLGMPDLESLWFAERSAFLGRSLTELDSMEALGWGGFSESSVKPVAESHRWPRGEELFFAKYRKVLQNAISVQWHFLASKVAELAPSGGYRFRSIRGATRLVAGGDSFSVELGVRFEVLEQLWVLAHLATSSECSAPSRLGLQSGPGRYAWLSRYGRGMKETALHPFYDFEWVRPFWSYVEEWTARIDPKQLVLLDVGYIVDNVLLPWKGEKRVMFLEILAVARMVIWATRKKGLYDDANFSHYDLILFFRRQMQQKMLGPHNIQQNV